MIPFLFCGSSNDYDINWRIDMGERVLITNRLTGISIFRYEDDYIFAKDKHDKGIKLSEARYQTLVSAFYGLIAIGETEDNLVKYFSSKEDYEEVLNAVTNKLMMDNNERFTEFEKARGYEIGSIVYVFSPMVVLFTEGEYYWTTETEGSELQLVKELDKELIKELRDKLDELSDDIGCLPCCRTRHDVIKLVLYLTSLI